MTNEDTNNSGGRVGPVIMGHPIARSCLESAGVVFSFRTSNRTTGNTHYRYKRTGKKQGDVTISQVSSQIKPTAANLEPYSHLSGFSNVDEWIEAIEEVHGDVESGYVYQIEMNNDE